MQKKLLNYSALSTALSTIGITEANGEIIHNDISDLTLTVNSYDMSIDLDGDKISDFSFYNYSYYYSSSSYTSNYIDISGRDNLFVVSTENTYALSKLNANEMIGSSSNLSDQGYASFIGSGSRDEWKKDTEGYVGVKFKIGNTFHYGWLRVSIDENYTLTIHEYAYEDIAETAIASGDTGKTTSVTKINISNDVSVYPNPAEDVIHLNSASAELSGATLILYNTLGEKIVETSLTKEGQIDLSDLSDGVYFIEITADKKRATKRVIKK